MASRTYYYKYATKYASIEKTNWKKSLSDAGGYAKWIYVYSYPEVVYINYDGNGADTTCSEWAEGVNTYNANTDILYTDGNPVCTAAFVKGKMASGANIYVSYAAGETKATANYVLHENKYYRIGYDFKGWAADKNATVATFTDEEILTDPGTQLGAFAGETVTLYAVWEKHDYIITYEYLCGNKSGDTYNYGTGLVLADLDVSSCGTVYDEDEGADFLGWYEDVTYTRKLTSIPSTYYSDITLYAKQSQSRYYNYETGSWKKAD